MMKKILLIANVLTLGVLLFFIVQKKTQKKTPSPCQYTLDAFDFHYKKETEAPNIVMIGTSMTRHGKWDSLLNRTDIINRGISGNNLYCIFERLQYLKGTTAKICFIEGGIIDLPAQNPDTLVNFYRKIIDFWNSEDVIPVINLVLYISPKAGINYPYLKDYRAVNTIIKNLNDKTRVLAQQNNIDFIDLNEVLSDNQGLFLKAEFTLDGIHLTESAYKIWAAEIEAILTRNEIGSSLR